MDQATYAVAAPKIAVGKREPLYALIVEPRAMMAEHIAELVIVPDKIELAGVASTEDEGHRICDQHRIRLAIIELQLDQGTGFGLIRRLRHADEPRCIIVLTSHAVPALKIASFEAGADFFLDKSKDLATLPKLVQEMLSTR